MSSYCTKFIEEKGKLFMENRRQQRRIEQMEKELDRKTLDQ